RSSTCVWSATSVSWPIESSVHGGARARPLFATRPSHEFTTAVWANSVHLLGAIHAICAFETANVCDSAGCERYSTFFACPFQLERHFFRLSISKDFLETIASPGASGDKD